MVLEIYVGQVDRGASLSFISQYADEEESEYNFSGNEEVHRQAGTKDRLKGMM